MHSQDNKSLLTSAVWIWDPSHTLYGTKLSPEQILIVVVMGYMGQSFGCHQLHHYHIDWSSHECSQPKMTNLPFTWNLLGSDLKLEMVYWLILKWKAFHCLSISLHSFNLPRDFWLIVDQKSEKKILHMDLKNLKTFRPKKVPSSYNPSYHW